jgi:hypothetical protein
VDLDPEAESVWHWWSPRGACTSRPRAATRGSKLRWLRAARRDILLLSQADDAVALCERAISLARRSGHAYSRSFALGHAALLYLLRREPDLASVLAAELRRHAHSCGFAVWEVTSEATDAIARIQRGELAEGSTVLEQAERWREIDIVLARSYFLCALADARRRPGDAANATRALDAASAHVRRTGESLPGRDRAHARRPAGRHRWDVDARDPAPGTRRGDRARTGRGRPGPAGRARARRSLMRRGDPRATRSCARALKQLLDFSHSPRDRERERPPRAGPNSLRARAVFRTRPPSPLPQRVGTVGASPL